jgi:hypothetical protein
MAIFVGSDVIHEDARATNNVGCVVRTMLSLHDDWHAEKRRNWQIEIRRGVSLRRVAASVQTTVEAFTCRVRRPFRGANDAASQVRLHRFPRQGASLQFSTREFPRGGFDVAHDGLGIFVLGESCTRKNPSTRNFRGEIVDRARFSSTALRLIAQGAAEPDRHLRLEPLGSTFPAAPCVREWSLTRTARPRALHRSTPSRASAAMARTSSDR